MKLILYILTCCFFGVSHNVFSQDTLICQEVEVRCQVRGEMVFNTKMEYKKNQDFMPGCSTNIGNIDFENNTLIGLTYGSGSKPIFKCNVVYNNQTKTYSHNTFETVYGIMKNGVVFSHWCIIPKLKEGQKVVFNHQVFYEDIENYPMDEPTK